MSGKEKIKIGFILGIIPGILIPFFNLEGDGKFVYRENIKRNSVEYDINYNLLNKGVLWKENGSHVMDSLGYPTVANGTIRIEVRGGAEVEISYRLKNYFNNDTLLDESITFEIQDSNTLVYANGTVLGKTMLILRNESFLEGSTYLLASYQNSIQVDYEYRTSKFQLRINESDYIYTHFVFGLVSGAKNTVHFLYSKGVLFRSSLFYFDPFLEEKFPEYDFVSNSKITYDNSSFSLETFPIISGMDPQLQNALIIIGIVGAGIITSYVFISKRIGKKLRNSRRRGKYRPLKRIGRKYTNKNATVRRGRTS